MDCKVFRQEIEELETGEPLSIGAQAHVNACVACRTFQTERLALRRLVGSLGAVSAPPDFDFRLRARLSAAKSARNSSFNRARFSPGLKAISVAASFVLLIAAAVVFRQFQPGQLNAPAASGNPSLAKAHDAQVPNPGEAGHLADPSQNSEATNVENRPAAPNTDIVSQQGTGTEKILQAKSPRNPVTARPNRAPVISNDSAFRGNPTVITPAQAPTATNTTAVETTAHDAPASLRVSPQPFKVLLHDRQGATRSVSLEPVIFGSRNILERAARQPATTSDNEGIW
jgi:hypothetical protein